MPIYRIVENAILEEREFRARAEDISEYLTNRAEGRAHRSLSLSFGREIISEQVNAGQEIVRGEASDFTPIGIGKPLTIELRHVYSGRFPKPSGFFGKRRDIAVVSGVKDYSSFAATTRALNFLERRVDANSHLKVPNAFNNGTSVIAYYPSVVADSLTLTVELASDDFSDDFVEQISKGLDAAGGIPLLLPYAGYLLGAGVVVRLAGSISNIFIDGGADFSITEAIAFDSPGAVPTRADFRLLCHAQNLAADYDYVAGVGLINRQTRQPYAGDEPYIIISLDGKTRPNLDNFAPTAASAGVLKSFFDIRDAGAASIDVVVEGLRLASDMRFRNQAIDLKMRISKLSSEDPERSRLEIQYAALVKNISNSIFMP